MDALIFDVDGTLWDSTEKVAVAWRQVCEREGVPSDMITPDRLKKEFGKTLENIGYSLFPFLPKEEAVRVTALACDLENESLLADPPALYPGVKKAFETLSQSLPLFIVSNCQAGYIEVLLETTGLTPYVKDHLCPGDTGEAKAANIRRITEQYHLKSAVYIGDTMGDYLDTKEAGLPFLFASYGFGNVPEPDGIIEKPEDLLLVPGLI